MYQSSESQWRDDRMARYVGHTSTEELRMIIARRDRMGRGDGVKITRHGPQAMTLAEEAAFDQKCARRLELITRMRKLMGWEASKSPVLTQIRAVACGDAVPISLDKLEQIVERLEKSQ